MIYQPWLRTQIVTTLRAPTTVNGAHIFIMVGLEKVQIAINHTSPRGDGGPGKAQNAIIAMAKSPMPNSLFISIKSVELYYFQPCFLLNSTLIFKFSMPRRRIVFI